MLGKKEERCYKEMAVVLKSSNKPEARFSPTLGRVYRAEFSSPQVFRNFGVQGWGNF